MDDIVEMLRTPTATEWELKAAKEIERLRKALKEIADDGKNCEGYCRRQAARAIRSRT